MTTTTATTEIVSQHAFGWCADGFHADHPSRPCKGAVRHTMGVRAGQVVLCGCRCHPWWSAHETQRPAPEHETHDESTPDPTPSVVGRATYYEAARGDDGQWVVVDPDGNPAKISGRSAWDSQDEVEVALANANRRKIAREWKGQQS